jgi:hypothetical protein
VLGSGDVHYYAPYERVHRQNVQAVSSS